MTPPKPKARLFVDAPLTAESRLELDDAQTHYLGHVMRFDAGDGVILFNGRDGEWSAVVEGFGKNRCSLSLNRQIRRQAEASGPWLAFAPLKKTPTDFLVEKATELGVSRLCPVFTGRTNSARINLDRMRKHAIEAAELSERLTVPEIAQPETLEQFAAGWPKDRLLLMLDESGGGRPIAEVLTELSAEGGANPEACGFLSGPEGGFDGGERDALVTLDFVTAVGLGPRILRAETAALAALACWQALLGDTR